MSKYTKAEVIKLANEYWPMLRAVEQKYYRAKPDKFKERFIAHIMRGAVFLKLADDWDYGVEFNEYLGYLEDWTPPVPKERKPMRIIRAPK